MAESRWRREVKGAVAARASAALRILELELKGCGPGPPLLLSRRSRGGSGAWWGSGVQGGGPCA
eukprot:9357867-Alexandrium_andersonii.AAC.1